MMNTSGIKLYIVAWVAYLLFAFLAFPQLSITVMMFSIPLTMVGGWVFLFRGALITTLITIPVHFLLLNLYADNPDIIMEAFNPFGIGSLLVFSCCTALLRSTQIEYKRLNESLEEIVLERTEDLEKLTHYLIDAQQLESRELNASLLAQPYKDLKSMLATSQLLKQKLKMAEHPRASDADDITRIISSCIKQLRDMDEDNLNSIPYGEDLPTSLANLKVKTEELHQVDIHIQDKPDWHDIEPEKVRFLSEIIFEAVSNALRHAEAERITVCIETDQDALIVVIENDGKPFSPTRKEGMGLPLMRFRAAKIGAELTIGPSQALSTRVSCRFPSPSKNSVPR